MEEGKGEKFNHFVVFIILIKILMYCFAFTIINLSCCWLVVFFFVTTFACLFKFNFAGCGFAVVVVVVCCCCSCG